MNPAKSIPPNILMSIPIIVVYLSVAIRITSFTIFFAMNLAKTNTIQPKSEIKINGNVMNQKKHASPRVI